jgi:hypothetical protein
MKKYEAGITETQYPYKPRWTGDVVEAENEIDADKMFFRQRLLP